MSKRKRKNFSQAVKDKAWKRDNGRCCLCGIKIGFGDPWHADHIVTDFHDGGNHLSNCQVLCVECHKEKTNTKDRPAIAKTKRWLNRAMGLRGTKRKGRPMAGTKDSGWKHNMDGTWTRR